MLIRSQGTIIVIIGVIGIVAFGSINSGLATETDANHLTELWSGVDYMTRWAEAVPTSRITAKDVAKFVLNSISCRFGTPLEIISDRGPGFRGDLVKELMIKLGVKHRHSTQYYPQCNGVVEKVNGMIYKLISKHVGNKTKH